MTFFSLVLRNLWRSKTRTLLTLAGITIGIATILVLGSVADGLSESFGVLSGAGEADFTIAQAQISDMMLSQIPEDTLDEVAELPGIERLDPVFLGITPVEHSPYFFLMGVVPDFESPAFSAAYEGREIRAGADEVMLGKMAASAMELDVGDTVVFFEHEFEVVGLYETGDTFSDGGALAPLDVVQRVAEMEDIVSMALVTAEAGVDLEELTATIERDWPGKLATIMDVDDIAKVDQGIEVVDAAAWMISALAVVIGGIGVMNTMIISVFDRTREIGVLKALGWTNGRVLRMVLAEVLLLGLASVVVATPLAFAAGKAVASAPVVASLLEPSYSAALWVQAIAVALLVALVGGFYPAYRAARFSPVVALRYE